MSQPLDYHDPLAIESTLSADESRVMLRAREFASQTLEPVVLNAFRQETFDPAIVKAMAAAGFFDLGMSYVEYGLVAREFERVDSGFRTLLSVVGGLVCHAINYFGSDVQKQRYLSRLTSGDMIGAFALTEPEHGSDPQNMQTVAREIADGYVLNGEKRWIGLADVADVIVVWAKDDTGLVRGFLVDKGTPNILIEKIPGKLSLRVVPSAHIKFKDVLIPKSNILPESYGLKSALCCLNHARYGIGWGALGAAEACFWHALNYIKQRNNFAAKQLVQQKLADMCSEISLGLAACLQVGRLFDTGSGCVEQISLIKRNSTVKALHIARQARDILGGNGILDTEHVVRHLLNLESVATYEGTADIHSLILGRSLTGVNAL